MLHLAVSKTCNDPNPLPYLDFVALLFLEVVGDAVGDNDDLIDVRLLDKARV